jgi:predicted ATPase
VADLPTGTVTFLFTDIEGSTRLLHELGDDYAEVLAEHHRALREAFGRHGGVEVDTQGDAFFVVFARASDALAAAAEGREALAGGPIRVRMGLHTGEPSVTAEGYVGIDVHRAARIAAAGHGGQILVSQATRDLTGIDGLRDLGEHRLKDLTAPERIYQLGEGDFPPLKSLNQTNLPAQPTPLVGRERELREIAELLRASRLLTLTGAGGSGKTRLALQAAAEMVEDHPDGVWFVSLAAVMDPQLVEPTIAGALGARDSLSDVLRGKKVLLLLDNLEQVLPHAAPLVASLDAKVLATSRERLNVSAEQEYEVSPLPLDDAVALFSQRARQLKPTFEPDEHVTAIARQLDGLPLALELAAALTKVLPPEQLRSRLERALDVLTTGARDAPERQRTLRSTVEWSYELLTTEEQELFARVSVFGGSFDFAAAETVVAATVERLLALVDKSLLRRTTEGRFFMLRTIGDLADERFRELPDAQQLRCRHAEYYLRLAEQTEADARGPAEEQWLRRLMNEQANFRAALTWALEVPDVETALRLTGALHSFWYHAGFHREGRRWAERALAAAGCGVSPARAKALATAGEFAGLAGDVELARGYLEESISIYRSLGDEGALPAAYTQLGHIAVYEGEFDLARSLYERSLEHESSEAWHTPAVAFNNIGYALLMKRDLVEAREALETGLPHAERTGSRLTEVTLLQNLAWVALLEDDYDRCRRLTREGLAVLRRVVDPLLVCEALELAVRVLATGDPRSAARLHGALTVQRSSLGIVDALVQQLAPKERYVEQARASVEAAEWDVEQEVGSRLSTEEAIELALSALD